MRFRGFALIGLSLAMLVSCAPKKETGRITTMKKQSFGKTAAGEEVDLYTLANGNGIEAAITNYGGIVVSLKVPDRTGQLGDVVLGFDTLDGYLKGHPYFGALIGRYGNRIAKGRFTLDGVEYKLAAQQRREPPARRPQGLRQGRLEGAGRLHAGRRGWS